MPHRTFERLSTNATTSGVISCNALNRLIEYRSMPVDAFGRVANTRSKTIANVVNLPLRSESDLSAVMALQSAPANQNSPNDNRRNIS